MLEFLESISGFLWGTPLLVFLLLANIILIYHSKLLPLWGFVHAIKLVFKKEEDTKHEGQLTHFEALSNALAATIGMGNIAGVAVAIYQGGAGAIFWMWISAIVGMNTKFFECTLAVLYRGKDYQGEIQGGPMYTIEKGLGEKFKPLAIAFAIFGLIGTLALFQINQLASFLETSYQVDPLYSGILFSVVLIYILLGGLKRIASFTSKVVPLMAILYLLLCFIVLGMNFELIIPTFLSIFEQAFGINSAVGGVSGYAIMHVIQTGVKRAAFSNEAGIGTAPMAHGNAKTNEPISEGYVAMLGPFIDTVIVCTLTAITILIGIKGMNNIGDLNGINLTTYAFTSQLGDFGRHALCIIIFLFAFSTMIGMANYNKKCWDYLFKGKYNLTDKTFIVFYGTSIAVAAIVKMNMVIAVIDICYAMMALPNIIATVWLAGKVKDKLDDYNMRMKK